MRFVNLTIWISAPIFGFLFVGAQPLVVLLLGDQWREAGPVLQILIISALGQLLMDSIIYLLVSRGDSRQLLKLMLITSPIMVGGYAIGLPFGILGVALSGSLGLLCSLPWMLRFAFRGTNLTLQRLAGALLYPITLCLAGVCLAELAVRFINPERLLLQLVVIALSFAAAYSVSALVPAVRRELISLNNLRKELRLPGETV